MILFVVNDSDLIGSFFFFSFFPFSFVFQRRWRVWKEHDCKADEDYSFAGVFGD